MNARQRRTITRQAFAQASCMQGKAYNATTGKQIAIIGKAAPAAEKPSVRVIRGDKRKVNLPLSAIVWKA